MTQQSLNEGEKKQLEELQCDADYMNEEPREEKMNDSENDADEETLTPRGCEQETTPSEGKKPLRVLNLIRRQDTSYEASF